ncbi:MAG: DUF4290 domain-containing protein [Bacteroidetes bacterium]|nr:DUF4290 domain-containing protein [Bacteroidota bacterium]
MDYNTARNYLSMREYGRHIQRMVEYVLTIEDKEKRNQQVKVIIEFMGLLNPHLKNVEDFRHILWDHLFFISDFKLDVDSPYPIPERETYKAKPDPMAYPKRYPRYRHLGKNLEMVIDKALQQEDQEKKTGFANSIAYYMKLSYSNWHKELVQDDVIKSELDSITGGELEFSNTPYIKHRITPERSNNGGRNNRRPSQGFGGRNNNGRSSDNRGGDNRNGGVRSGNPNNRNNNGRSADNRNGGGSSTNRNNNNRNFKKRF